MKLVIGKNGQRRVPVVKKEIERLPALGLLRAKDANGKLIASTTESQIMDFTGVADIEEYMLVLAYSGNTAISGAVDMSDLITVSGSYACSSTFRGCTGLTSVDLSSLTTVSGTSACARMFYGCTGLKSVDLSSLTTLSGNQACQNMFYDCDALTSVDMSSLTTITGATACQSMFQNCAGLTSVNMSGLTTINSRMALNTMFQDCTSLTTVSIGNTTAIDFGTQTNQFSSMFYSCTQNIDVYAPAANQTQIESFSGYPNFGATGNVIWHWNTAA